jgi:hypothetical protein
MTIQFALSLAAVVVTSGASLILGTRLKGIADRLPPINDPTEHTSMYFLGRVGTHPRGRRLVPWFWAAQVSLLVAIIALLIS